MEFRNLSTFVRVAELRSFSAAARELGYSQSAISMQIAQLEEELNSVEVRARAVARRQRDISTDDV